jgi:hypothetical protein
VAVLWGSETGGDLGFTNTCVESCWCSNVRVADVSAQWIGQLKVFQKSFFDNFFVLEIFIQVSPLC